MDHVPSDKRSDDHRRRATDQTPEPANGARPVAASSPGAGYAQRAQAADDTAIIPRPGSDDTAIIPRPAADDTAIVARPGPDETAVIPVIPGPVSDDTAVIRRPGSDETAVIPVIPRRAGGRLGAGRLPGRALARTAQRIMAPPDRERRARPRGGPYDLGHAPAVLVASSLGVLLVALAYAGGRHEQAGSIVAYWIGQIVVFTPVVIRLLSRRMAGVAEAFTLVMGLAVNQYLLKWMYSPDQFRFPDELQHWLATTILVQTGELYQPNLALPPVVHFPGLAEMGAAIADMTGLPVTAAGIIIAGVAHLIFVGVLFAAVLRASNSPAVAGVACATYATALHYLFFNSMFLYQTAALPFFILTVWATRRWREEGGWPYALVAVVSIVMTTVSHHVTAFALAATMILLGVTELVTERPRRWSALAMPAVTVGSVAAWIQFVATDVIGYLSGPIEQIGQSLSQLVTGGASDASTRAIAIEQLVVQGVGLIGLFVLYLAVGRDMWVRRDRDTWRWAALVGGAIFFLGNGVRFLGYNGPEASGRLATFTYIPISIIAAIALVRAVQILPNRDSQGRRWWVQPALEVPPPKGRGLVVRVAAGSALVTLLMVGARTGGWPPVGSLLPGRYLAGGFERSVDAYGVRAADWERTTLGPGNRVGGDMTSVNLASTYGRQNPVREVGALFYSTEWGLNDDELVSTVGLQYLVVDRRLGTQLPESGSYFQNDPMAGRITRPLSAAQLGKFDNVPSIDRLYDSGTVRVYRMNEGQ